MPISRIDLDGKGAGSPEGLVSIILKAEPSLPIPIPIEKLCTQLDISSIEYEILDGLEGVLITNAERECGVILVNKKSHRFRQRFTIGHELGHFLIPTHMPNSEGRFLCSRADMLLQHTGEQDRRARMEIEANRFASLILIPPPYLRSKLKGDPSLKKLTDLAAEFEVSKEAMARSYSLHHHETIAIVVSENGIVRRIYKSQKFPFISVRAGSPVPANSLGSRPRSRVTSNRITEICQCLPDLWIEIERGKLAPKLYEQVMEQSGDFVMIMLWLEAGEEEEFDREENMTSKERLRDRIFRSGS